MKTLRGFVGLVGLGLLAMGCASSPAPPFDTLKTARLDAFRLQNYEAPAAPAAQAAPAAGAPQLPGLPPEITQWAQQALPGLQQLLPPGLLPPGMMQGVAAPPAAAPPPPDAPRFPMAAPNFRILGQTQIIDPELKEELAELLGSEDSFHAEQANCMYAEMGISIVAGGPPKDLLVSFSCNRVEARGFAWPHPNTGLKPETVQSLAAVVQKIWPQG